MRLCRRFANSLGFVTLVSPIFLVSSILQHGSLLPVSNEASLTNVPFLFRQRAGAVTENAEEPLVRRLRRLLDTVYMVPIVANRAPLHLVTACDGIHGERLIV